MRRRVTLTAVAVGVVLAAVLLTFAATASSGSPAKPGLIAFVSDRDRIGYGPWAYQVYVMNADGSGQRHLSRTSENDASPVWSPDGKRIAFTSLPASPDLYVINGDGSGQRRLTRDRGVFLNGPPPAWSPDGRLIAYGTYKGEIYVSDAEGGGEKRLTADGLFPAWSPDGKQIGYASQGGLSTMNADGSSQRRLIRARCAVGAPAWSPDGRTIIFLRACSKTKIDLYRVNADGSGERRLASRLEKEAVPRWSPDGKKILFTALYTRRDGSSATAITVINPDGSGRKRLVSNVYSIVQPAWSSDGKKIVFYDWPPGVDADRHIYVINADGSGKKRLTSKGENQQPSWQPPPRR